jgi:hypothetical protein
MQVIILAAYIAVFFRMPCLSIFLKVDFHILIRFVRLFLQHLFTLLEIW